MTAAGQGGGAPGRLRTTQDSLFGYVLLTPAVALLAFLIIYPLVLALVLSVTPGRFLNPATARPGVALEHYQRVLFSVETWGDLSRSFLYVLGSIAPAFLTGLGLALLFRRPFRGRRWLRTMVLLPWAVPGIAASMVFLWMFDASFGIVNKALLRLGLLAVPIAWLADTRTALAAVMVPTAWKLFPLFTMVFMAALQAIPLELYEAAKVDGASSPVQFRYVTWPGLRGSAYIVTLIAFLGVFREFDFIFPLTSGGPGHTTMTLAVDIYLQAFQYSDLGYAAALGIFSLMVATIVVLTMSRAMRRTSV
jgi:multiple sugar transport system permease protein